MLINPLSEPVNNFNNFNNYNINQIFLNEKQMEEGKGQEKIMVDKHGHQVVPANL
eukprot:CAMPEP_0202960660 /NCGR_PEP_ID=MMETSP1396-20130829/4814_1 /ASSEMBLY_ACC=CAM_ASM_000872 /TAXON_ID= /ORGANISM="Pseudokeronopsis sp., Strain Brazil" /LENGTH=54 /DNA_ID=CAMNT_0049680025 /DNA_START=135 /DNA_END=295 /DNA_ORIENTATION=+